MISAELFASTYILDIPETLGTCGILGMLVEMANNDVRGMLTSSEEFLYIFKLPTITNTKFLILITECFKELEVMLKREGLKMNWIIM